VRYVAESPRDPVILSVVRRPAPHRSWVVAIAGIVVMWRRDRPQAVLTAATIFYFLFMAAGGKRSIASACR